MTRPRIPVNMVAIKVTELAELRQKIDRLKELNADLLAACEANFEYQEGTHSSFDEILDLAEKCKQLTAAAIAKATGAAP